MRLKRTLLQSDWSRQTMERNLQNDLLGNVPESGRRRRAMDDHKAAISRLFEQRAFPEGAFYIDKSFAGRKIIVYGAGECCHWACMEVVVGIDGFMPSLVLDRSFKRGDTYEGAPAFSPFDCQPTKDEKRNAIMVICVGKQEYHAEIIGYLKALGLHNIIRLLDVYEVHNPFNQPVELKTNGFKFYLERKARILNCLELFADDQRREIFTRVMQTDMRRKPVPLPERPRNEQYFPKDIKLTRGCSQFVSCGGDTGSTVRLLNEILGKLESIACFEPDPYLFAEFADYRAQNKDKLAQNVVAFPCAVYGKDGQPWSLRVKRVLVDPACVAAIRSIADQEIKEADIIALIDRDQVLHEKLIDGIPIHSYGEIKALRPDVILAAAPETHRADILRTLAMHAGVDVNIVLFDTKHKT